MLNIKHIQKERLVYNKMINAKMYQEYQSNSLNQLDSMHTSQTRIILSVINKTNIPSASYHKSIISRIYKEIFKC